MTLYVPWAGDESENGNGCECLHVGVERTDAGCPYQPLFIQYFYLKQIIKHRIMRYITIVCLFKTVDY